MPAAVCVGGEERDWLRMLLVLKSCGEGERG